MSALLLRSILTGQAGRLGREQWDQRPCPIGAQLFDQGCLGGLCSRGLTAWNGGGFADAFDVYISRARQRERAFVLGLSVLGLILDSAWIHLGILDFGADSLNVANIQLAPLWIVMLWVAVGLSLFEALGFFVRPLVGALIVGATRRCPFHWRAIWSSHNKFFNLVVDHCGGVGGCIWCCV